MFPNCFFFNFRKNLFAIGGSWWIVIKPEICIISMKRSKPNRLPRRKNSKKENKKVVYEFVNLFQILTRRMIDIHEQT
jgi:hypothetical protein